MQEPGSLQAHGPPRTRGTRQIRAEGSHFNQQVLLPAERLIYNETISGALLLVCAIVALVWANSPWSQSYIALHDTLVLLQIGTFVFSLDLQHWINDGLMAIFFFVMAMELKCELIDGDFSEARKAALPLVAALGGMIVPAGIYLVFNASGKGATGWGIPMAIGHCLRRRKFSRYSAGASRRICGYSCSPSRSPPNVGSINYTAHFPTIAMEVASNSACFMTRTRKVDP